MSSAASSSSSSSVKPPGRTSDTTLLYPFTPGAEMFQAVKDEGEASEALWNRCWFATCIHVLAHEPAVFALTQEVIIVMSSLPMELALAIADPIHPDRFILGIQLAYLVQQSSCPELVSPPDLGVFKNALDRALRVFPSKDGDGAQAFADYYGLRLRPALLDACNALVSSNDAHSNEPFMIVTSGSNHLETDLAATKTSTPEWIRVDRTSPGVPVMYHPRDVRVGKSAVYEVAFTVQFSGAHFAFCDQAGEPFDSHGASSIARVVPAKAGTQFVRNTQSSHIFLRRLSK